MFEFFVLGGLSGLFAAAGAELLGWVLAHFVLEIPYQLSISIWFAGVLGGVAIVMLAGWLATRSITKLSPMQILSAG
jgi:putative ABC transport system permease protein